jgi:hypothetical protein
MEIGSETYDVKKQGGKSQGGRSLGSRLQFIFTFVTILSVIPSSQISIQAGIRKPLAKELAQFPNVSLEKLT